MIVYPKQRKTDMDKIARIRQEIERLKAKYRKDMYKSDHEGLVSGYKIEAYNELLFFIDSLSEEPSKGLDVTDFCKPIDPGIAQCVADHWWEMMAEEPDKSLEEEIQRYLREECSGDDEPSISEIARHFAKWGAEHLKK